jgi:hypothetical protein
MGPLTRTLAVPADRGPGSGRPGRDHWRALRRGPNVHTTILADGTVTSFQDKVSLECR